MGFFILYANLFSYICLTNNNLMKKIFTTLLITFSISTSFSQSYIANDSLEFSNWTTFDLDSDGENWMATDISFLTNGMEIQGGCMISKSWDGIPLTPNNITISPEIDFSTAAEVFITFTAGSTRSTASEWYQEHYAVYVVSSESQMNDLAVGIFPTATFETTLSGGEEMFLESFTLPPAAGNDSVHVVFRHFNCSDENYLIIDDFELTGALVGIHTNTLEVISAYPNPAHDVLNIKANQKLESVSLFSLDGKLIISENINTDNVTLDVRNVPTGIYFYEIKTSTGESIKEKIIVK
jgi:hypothetical protein